jgi:ABC-type multidrug transport system fused ATPase/permease subunit
MKKQPKHKEQLIRRYLQFLRPYWHRGVLIGILAIINLGLAFAIPLTMAYLIDEVLIGGQRDKFVFAFVIFLVASQSPAIFEFMQAKLEMITKEYVNRDIRLRLFEKIEHLPISFLQKHPSGELVSKFTNDINQMGPLSFGSLISIAITIIQFFVAAFILMRMDLPMAAMCLAIVPLYLLVVAKFKHPIDERYRGVMEANDKNMENYHDSLDNLFLVKAFVLEGYEKSKMQTVIDDYIDKLRRFINIMLASQAFSRALKAANILIVFGYGGYQVIQGNLTVGSLVAFRGISNMLFSDIDSFVNRLLDIEKGKVVLKRLYEILDEKEEDYSIKSGKKDFKVTQGEIEFKDITFSYDGNTNILENFNLKIKPGEKIAIVGPSGSGKSTVVKLLFRFFEQKSGHVLIDNTDVTEIDVATLRGQIGEVLQSNFIMKGTVAENISFGEEAHLDSIKTAAEKAFAHDFIEKLPNKYDEIISQGYANLSGGQLQRIAIARAILKDRPVLVLDEATSALDPESEHLILRSLDHLLAGRTTIMISHHPGTLKKTDRIIVIDNKNIAEEGSFDELVKKGGLFSQLIKFSSEE